MAAKSEAAGTQHGKHRLNSLLFTATHFTPARTHTRFSHPPPNEMSFLSWLGGITWDILKPLIDFLVIVCLICCCVSGFCIYCCVSISKTAKNTRLGSSVYNKAQYAATGAINLGLMSTGLPPVLRYSGQPPPSPYQPPRSSSGSGAYYVNIPPHSDVPQVDSHHHHRQSQWEDGHF